MRLPNDYFDIHFKTKPYILKYLHATYGNSIRFYAGNQMGEYLSSKLVDLSTEEINEEMKNKLENNTLIKLPKSWFNKYGTGLKSFHSVQLHQHLENEFEAALFMTVEIFTNRTRYTGINDLLENKIATSYNIKIDKDITMDALIKKVYRVRKEYNKHESVKAVIDFFRKVIYNHEENKGKKLEFFFYRNIIMVYGPNELLISLSIHPPIIKGNAPIIFLNGILIE